MAFPNCVPANHSPVRTPPAADATAGGASSARWVELSRDVGSVEDPVNIVGSPEEPTDWLVRREAYRSLNPRLSASSV